MHTLDPQEPRDERNIMGPQNFSAPATAEWPKQTAPQRVAPTVPVSKPARAGRVVGRRRGDYLIAAVRDDTTTASSGPRGSSLCDWLTRAG